MVRRFTPFIGLAVVVALALAAVFGSMSLANPAMAAIGQPADAELTERTVSPQAATLEVADGEEKELDLTELIEGGGANYKSTGTIQVIPATLLAATPAPAVSATFSSITLTVTGATLADGADPLRGRVIVPVTLEGATDAATDDTVQRIRVDVTLVQETSVSAVGSIMDQRIAVNDDDFELDVEDYFTNGRGTGGAIASYGASDPDAIETRDIAITDPTGTATVFTIDVTNGTDPGAAVGDSFFVTITATDAGSGTATQSFFIDVVAVTEEVGEKPTVEPAGMDPGENTKYTVKFKAGDDITTGVDEITVEFKDFSVPSSVDADTVTVSVTGDYDEDGRSCTPADTPEAGDTCRAGRTFTNDAASVSVDGEKLIIDLKVRSDDFVDIIKKGVTVTVVIGQSAGISNPTEAKGYDEVEVNGEAAEDVMINLKLSLSEDEGGRGDTITVTGKGFKNGTTMTAYRVMGATNDFAQSQSVCSATVGSDDVGKCDFTVTSPLFKSGANYINVKDGRNQSVMESKNFTLEPSISVSPEGASVGDSVQVQMYDFISGSSVQGVRIARQYLCMKSGMPVKLMTSCSDGEGYSNWTPGGSASTLGELSFNVSIPDGAPQGRQELRVETAGENDATNIVISGPVITTTPTTVLANQRVSLTGAGFTSGSEVATITFAGEVIPAANIQAGQHRSLTWTMAATGRLSVDPAHYRQHHFGRRPRGSRLSRPSMGRGWFQVMVTVPERSVTITPDTGRVGTVAVVRGEWFPQQERRGFEAFSI